MTTAVLALEDGSLFFGKSIGVSGETIGEVVFNTAITGYQEILPDPSYSKQIVTLTYPHIGNVGTNAGDEEAAGVSEGQEYLQVTGWTRVQRCRALDQCS